MEAAWARAVDRATDMADSARRFFLSFRRPQQQQQQPPPPPSPNPVSELTPFSLRSSLLRCRGRGCQRVELRMHLQRPKPELSLFVEAEAFMCIMGPVAKFWGFFCQMN